MRKSLKKQVEDSKLITEKDFQLFTRSVTEFRTFFGLLDWEIFSVLEEADEDLGSFRGWMRANFEDRICIIGLSPDWEFNYLKNDREICKVAFHECCELLLANLGALGSAKFCSFEMNMAAHEVIRRLENSVFPLVEERVLGSANKQLKKARSKKK